jgi:hypothetical protein
VYTQAVIEISPQADGQLPTELILAAYRASERGPIVFVLRGVTAADIDRILDDLVPLLPVSIPGVKYVDIKNEGAILDAVSEAGMIFADTDHFRTFVRNLNIERAAIRSVDNAVMALSGKPETIDDETRPIILS